MSKSAQRHNEPSSWAKENLEAYLALSGSRSDVARVLANILRSDTPLDPILRSALADAFEGKRPEGCPTFAVIGLGRGPCSIAGLTRFKRDVAVAETVHRLIEEGATREAAEREVAGRFNISEELCHKAVTGFRKMEKWLSALTPIEPPDGISETDWKRMQRPCYLASVGPLTR